jgi:hypothetical protein
MKIATRMVTCDNQGETRTETVSEIAETAARRHEDRDGDTRIEIAETAARRHEDRETWADQFW